MTRTCHSLSIFFLLFFSICFTTYKVVGRQDIPPYWGLGFQLSKWNYRTLDRVKKVVQELKDADIPHVCLNNWIEQLTRCVMSCSLVGSGFLSLPCSMLVSLVNANNISLVTIIYTIL